MDNKSARRWSKFLHDWRGFTRSGATTLLILSLCRAQGAPQAKDTGKASQANVSRCTRDQSQRQEISRAVRESVASLYPNDCRGLENGRTFAIHMEEIRLQGSSADVTYVLDFFESCEEGAPFSGASRYKERWIRKTNSWQRE